MERWKGRVALVTGASVGIGAAVTRALVQQGMRVVGCARNVDKIEKDAKTKQKPMIKAENITDMLVDCK
ncbi:Dehydrogenase/reductase SDR member 11 [Ilyodon furcidens]|uniref:Dehydrogenase/reductase SDR member 11 n=1 Tax=Ilyodon furcidens TaxID=33524 RepID=A0ABV0TR39_9TELE